MKHARSAPAPAVDECPQCTAPTRCGRIGDGKRGPRCVGRADGLDNCDCLNGCGDDPWLANGKAVPCARRAQEAAAAVFRATAGPAEYASWFPVPHGVETGVPAQPSDEQILEVAHRTATRYAHGHREPYSFNDRQMLHFARSVLGIAHGVGEVHRG